MESQTQRLLMLFGKLHPILTRKLTFVRNALLKQHIIIPVDGPDENVLKIKSPMCLTIQNADEILERMETVLEQLN